MLPAPAISVIRAIGGTNCMGRVEDLERPDEKKYVFFSRYFTSMGKKGQSEINPNGMGLLNKYFSNDQFINIIQILPLKTEK